MKVSGPLQSLLFNFVKQLVAFRRITYPNCGKIPVLPLASVSLRLPPVPARQTEETEPLLSLVCAVAVRISPALGDRGAHPFLDDVPSTVSLPRAERCMVRVRAVCLCVL